MAYIRYSIKRSFIILGVSMKRLDELILRLLEKYTGKRFVSISGGEKVVSQRDYRTLQTTNIVLEKLADGIIETGQDLHTIIEFSHGAERIYGISREEALGMDVSRLWLDPSERNGLLQRLEEEDSVVHETKFRRKVPGTDREEEIYISFSLTLLRDEDGEKIGTVGIARDITEKKRLEEERKNHIIDIIQFLYKEIEGHDSYTKDHTLMVAIYSEKIAKALGMGQQEIDTLSKYVQLHDLGKIDIKKETLNNQRTFLDEDGEMVYIREHTTRGAAIIKNFGLPRETAEVALYHHERWDGEGYPAGLKGEGIPLNARIVAIADAYDSMTSLRTYKGMMDVKTAIEEFKRCSGMSFNRKMLFDYNKNLLNNIITKELLILIREDSDIEAILSPISEECKMALYQDTGGNVCGSVIDIIDKHNSIIGSSNKTVMEFLARIKKNTIRYLVDRMENEMQFDPLIAKVFIDYLEKNVKKPDHMT